MTGPRSLSRPLWASSGPGLLVAVAVSIAIALAGPAAAGQVSLRDSVSSNGDITLGDLFDQAGASGSVVVGYGAPPGQSAVLDANAVQRIARDHGLDWSNPDDIRRIVVPSALGSARAPQTVEVLTYARDLIAGEVVRPEDLIYAQTPALRAPSDAPRNVDEVIGKAARRPLRSGAAVAERDVGPAQVIRPDDVVEVSYLADGIEVTLQGKAQGAAAVGEPVNVLNTSSKKVVQAIATGPDQAVVGPEADQFRAAPAYAAPAQIAALK